MSPQEAHRVRRRWVIGTVVAVVVAVALMTGGPWVYAHLFAPEAPEPLAVPTQSPTSEPSPEPSLAPSDIEGTWRVAEGSEAGYRLREVLTGQEVTVVGRSEAVTGTVEVAGGSLVAADVSVETATIETDEAARDAYFRRALDTVTHPEATFELTGPVDVSGLAASTDPVAFTAPGRLTLAGRTVDVTADLEARRTAEGVVVAGSIPITLADFGLLAPDVGFVTVQPAGEVEMRLVLTR